MSRALYSPDGPHVAWEGTEPRYCDADTQWVPRGLVDEASRAVAGTLRDLDHGAHTPAWAADRIRESLRLLTEACDEHQTEAPCDYDGPAPVTVLGRRHQTCEWVCPRCGAEHSDDIDEDMR